MRKKDNEREDMRKVSTKKVNNNEIYEVRVKERAEGKGESDGRE